MCMSRPLDFSLDKYNQICCLILQCMDWRIEIDKQTFEYGRDRRVEKYMFETNIYSRWKEHQERSTLD